MVSDNAESFIRWLERFYADLVLSSPTVMVWEMISRIQQSNGYSLALPSPLELIQKQIPQLISLPNPPPPLQQGGGGIFNGTQYVYNLTGPAGPQTGAFSLTLTMQVGNVNQTTTTDTLTLFSTVDFITSKNLGPVQPGTIPITVANIFGLNVPASYNFWVQDSTTNLMSNRVTVNAV